MSSAFLTTTRILAVAAGAMAASCAWSQDTPLVITHATIIDATGAPPQTGMTVIIENGRIASIRRDSNTGGGAHVVDAAGKFLIPGLRDMHVHLGGYEAAKQTLPRLLAHGITGVRDMASPPDDILRLRQEVRTAQILGPQIVAAGPILQAKLPFRMPPMVRTVADPAEARRAVAELQRQGVDFIKVGDTLSRESYLAIADESRRARLPLAGHLPVSITAIEASRAGQASVEHFGSVRFHGLLVACSTEQEQLSATIRAALEQAMTGGPAPDELLFSAAFVSRLMAGYDGTKAAALYSELSRNRTWQVPTLVALRSVWRDKQSTLDQDAIDAGLRLFERYAEMTRQMQVAGVGLLAGSDLPIGNGVPPLHDELVLLVEAGLSPMQALQTATRNAADFLGRLSAEGTVEVGKRADLVLLDASPLDDIKNTRAVAAVIVAGHYLDGAELQRMRAPL